MSVVIEITCNHTLISTNFTDFPCQLNLSSILVSYPAVKAQITAASDINVYDPTLGSYVTVNIDLDLPNDKFLLYFSGDINSVADKLFWVMIGYQSSVNSYAVFSPYYERFWGINSYDPYPANDPCLASGTLMYRGGTQFGYNTLFYKGGRAGSSSGSNGQNIPCINGTSVFTVHLRCSKVDGYSTGYGHYFTYTLGLNQVFWLRQTTGNLLELHLAKDYPSSLWRKAYISTAGWTLNAFYDVFIAVNLLASTNAEKVKFYVNGHQVTVSFNAAWYHTTTVVGTSNVALIGYAGEYNVSTVDFIGFTPETFSDDFILTTANQYLDSSFWTVGSIYIPEFHVTYEGNGADSGLVEDSTVYDFGDTATVLGVGNLIRRGYVFKWWNTESDGSGTTYNEGDTFLTYADEILYAIWAYVPVGSVRMDSYRSWISRLMRVYSPYDCPESFLPYLARYLGYNLKYEDFLVTITDVDKKRVQIKEAANWYRLKGTNRSFSYIFEVLEGSTGASDLNPELAWVRLYDASWNFYPDPRDDTVWIPLNYYPDDPDPDNPGFDYIPSYSISATLGPNFVPDSRIRLDLSLITVTEEDLLNILDRLEEVKPYHLIFDFTIVPSVVSELYEEFFFGEWPGLYHDDLDSYHDKADLPDYYHSRAGGPDTLAVSKKDAGSTTAAIGEWVVVIPT